MRNRKKKKLAKKGVCYACKCEEMFDYWNKGYMFHAVCGSCNASYTPKPSVRDRNLARELIKLPTTFTYGLDLC